MNLKEILEKDELQEFKDDINKAVDTIKAKAIADKDKEISKLTATIEAKDQELANLGKETFDKELSSIVKELVGDDEKKQNILKKLTDLGEEKDTNKIKELFETTIKDYESVFGADGAKEPIEPDGTIDNTTYQADITAKTKDNNESYSLAFDEDK